MREIKVIVVVKDSLNNRTTQEITVIEQSPVKVAGGYYVSSNGDMRPDTTNQGMNLKGFTQYRSLADGSMFPGYQKDYLRDYIANGIWGNYVLELKHYGAASGAQSFSVDGVKYSVPAPNMTTQQRPGQSWPLSYGYSQVLSGQIDGLLHRAAYQLLRMPVGKINVQLASEFDTDHEFGIKDGDSFLTWEQADAEALKALHYMIDYFRNYGIGQNVTFTVGMGGFNRAAFKRMHPETLMPKIGYLQWNAYRRSVTQTAYSIFNRTKLWSDADLGPIAKSKDIIIAEWGTPYQLDNQAAFIRTVPAAIDKLNDESKTGKFVMTNYFNSNATWGTLNPKQAGLDALKEIYLTPPYA
jgi:hypothetical protein